MYGVCLAETGAVEAAASERRRAEIRGERLAAAQPVEVGAGNGAEASAVGPPVPIGDALVALPTASGWRYRCQRCQHDYGVVDQPKRAAHYRELPITASSDWNRFGLVDAVVLRELYCPACAHLLGVEVRRKGDPPLLDTLLAAPQQALRPTRFPLPA